jgi:hypothetical protein
MHAGQLNFWPLAKKWKNETFSKPFFLTCLALKRGFNGFVVKFSLTFFRFYFDFFCLLRLISLFFFYVCSHLVRVPRKKNANNKNF